jgi:hypothetical protein
MKRIACLLLLVLGSSLWIYAQNSQQMGGTICNAACVIQKPDTATCDPKCDITGGTDVLIDDALKVHKVSNQEMCTSHEGKHVVVVVTPADTPAGTSDGQSVVVIQELHER